MRLTTGQREVGGRVLPALALSTLMAAVTAVVPAVAVWAQAAAAGGQVYPGYFLGTFPFEGIIHNSGCAI